jgi:hypothetical protein
MSVEGERRVRYQGCQTRKQAIAALAIYLVSEDTRTGAANRID